MLTFPYVLTIAQLTLPSLYVKNLNDKLQKTDLKRNLYMLFATYGVVLDVIALKTPRMRGQAHIVFRDADSSTQAMRALQGFEFFGKPMVGTTIAFMFANCFSSANLFRFLPILSLSASFRATCALCGRLIKAEHPIRERQIRHRQETRRHIPAPRARGGEAGANRSTSVGIRHRTRAYEGEARECARRPRRRRIDKRCQEGKRGRGGRGG